MNFADCAAFQGASPRPIRESCYRLLLALITSAPVVSLHHHRTSGTCSSVLLQFASFHNSSHLAKLARKLTLTVTIRNCTARAFGLPSPLWAEIFAYFCLPAAAEQREKLLRRHNSCSIPGARRRPCSSPGRISFLRASFPGVGAGARE